MIYGQFGHNANLKLGPIVLGHFPAKNLEFRGKEKHDCEKHIHDEQPL